ncbi:MAG TPA: zinc ribbon domain-containing protein [Anaerolineaceae bacterium]
MHRSTFLMAGALLISLTILVKANVVEAQVSATQEIPTFTSVEVDLWPEYDQPSVLVVYHLILAPGTALPASLTLHIPSTAGDPYNLASRQTDGQLYNMAYTRTVEGNFSRINFTTTTQEIQFEYYDPGINKTSGDQSPYPILKRGKSQRAYTYEWQGDYAVKSMLIQVQQPLGATQMTITPALGSGVAGEGGLVYYNGQVGAVTANTKFKVFLSYQKPDDSLSAPALKVQPSSPITPQTSGRTFNLMDYLPWILGGAGVLLAAGGGLWYWRSIREERRTFSLKPIIARGKPKESSLDERIYCYQCGKQAGEGDIFCRSCGTRLRKE